MKDYSLLTGKEVLRLAKEESGLTEEQIAQRPVSYTHLDVYKRQAWDFSHGNIAKAAPCRAWEPDPKRFCHPAPDASDDARSLRTGYELSLIHIWKERREDTHFFARQTPPATLRIDCTTLTAISPHIFIGEAGTKTYFKTALTDALSMNLERSIPVSYTHLIYHPEKRSRLGKSIVLSLY